MRIRLSTLTGIFTAGAMTLAGCGGNGAATDPAADFRARAAVVADAWHSATSQTPAWQSQIIAVQALTISPASGLSGDAQRAFDSGWYRSQIPMPDQVPAPAKIAVPGAGEVTASLVSAAAAFADIDKGDAPCQQQAPLPTATDPSAPAGGPAAHSCVDLTVTSVKLGSLPLRTNRGILQVPAWLFQTKEASDPVARVAVTAATFAALPKSGAASWDNAPVSAAIKLRQAGQEKVEFIVPVEACAKDLSGLVYETDSAVVVAGWAKGRAAGACAGSAALEPVTVTLTSPLAARVILDGVSGQPLL